MKQVSLLVEDYHYEKLKDMAWKRRISMSELLRDMIDESEDDKDGRETERASNNVCTVSSDGVNSCNNNDGKIK